MGKYHVVCHQCPEEAVYDDGERARQLKSNHETETGHRVSCKEITAGVTDA